MNHHIATSSHPHVTAGSHPRLPYSVEDARFASFALAHAYAQFVAEDRGHEVAVAKFGIVVERVSP